MRSPTLLLHVALSSEVSRDVQAEGWGFNTDYDVSLAMDSSNQFPLPDNALRVDFSPNTYPEQQYVARGNQVYDRSTQRYDFGSNSDTLTVDSMVASWIGMNCRTLRSSTSQSERSDLLRSLHQQQCRLCLHGARRDLCPHPTDSC